MYNVRVVHSDGWHKVQARYLFFFWRDVGVDVLDGEFKLGRTRLFSGKSGAADFAKRYKCSVKKKWKVVHLWAN